MNSVEHCPVCGRHMHRISGETTAAAHRDSVGKFCPYSGQPFTREELSV